MLSTRTSKDEIRIAHNTQHLTYYNYIRFKLLPIRKRRVLDFSSGVSRSLPLIFSLTTSLSRSNHASLAVGLNVGIAFQNFFINCQSRSSERLFGLVGIAVGLLGRHVSPAHGSSPVSTYFNYDISDESLPMNLGQTRTSRQTHPKAYMSFSDVGLLYAFRRSGALHLQGPLPSVVSPRRSSTMYDSPKSHSRALPSRTRTLFYGAKIKIHEYIRKCAHWLTALRSPCTICPSRLCTMEKRISARSMLRTIAGMYELKSSAFATSISYVRS